VRGWRIIGRMGFLKDTKANMLTTEATRARAEGRSVFVPLLNTPTATSGMSGSISGWAEMIEAVESAGWRLDQWSVSTDTNGRPQAYPLFRRA
jgi:hypothetical protein